MTESQSKSERESGSSAGIVIVVVLLLLLLPCIAGLFLLGGFFLFQVRAPQPIALPPVPGANAPLPGNGLIPPNATITVNEMKWSGNLFEGAAEILTLARYDLIQPGMTYDELLAVLAIPENKRPPDMELIGPASDVELKWFGGPDDSLSITVKMKGKTVTQKSQSGLK